MTPQDQCENYPNSRLEEFGFLSRRFSEVSASIIYILTCPDKIEQCKVKNKSLPTAAAKERSTNQEIDQIPLPQL